ncbi:MAG TPA: nucleoside monophosphate kinase [Candidatus Paceibacterota bacterium]|nr:nucleoside monophosphate kinase [Candidatus Pacearchaeota archaeon]HRZ50939.1 nucleoside monophosphate kinase [Candidatus Paceibacterota bacterium]HSA36660.1 nucleoside monophosphate kinase [Candidatus Paceibacterota bacterium]
MKFPIFKTKMEGKDKTFNLTDPVERNDYFHYKVDEEIDKLKDYVRENSFIVYLLGKKNSGKGTYSKMFAEIINPERIDHFSVGDMIREVSKDIQDGTKKQEIEDYLKKEYRGWVPAEDLIKAIENRDTKTLLPTELILALVKREIAKRPKKTIFIDGFPREMDQVSYSLFFRDLIGFRNDQDVLAFIDVPTNVIEERIKWRRICPVCNTSRSIKLLPTAKIGYDEGSKEFYLICDNPKCPGHNTQKLGPKEGDELGIAPLKDRLELDQKLMEKAMTLYGIPKVYLRNAIPAELAKDYVDDYELTPEFEFAWDGKEVKTTQKPWTVKDDEGVTSHSLMAAPVVVSLIKQLASVLGL